MTVLTMDSASPLAAMALPELVEASRGFTRAQNLAAVDRLDAVFAMVCAATRRAEEADRCDEAEGRGRGPEYTRLEPARLVRSHVTTAMGAPSWQAGRLVTAAIQLHTRLFRLSRHAREGVLDEAMIVDLACRLAKVPDRLVHEVECEVLRGIRTRLDQGDPPTRGSLGEFIDRAMEGVDRDELDRQHEAAREERRVSFRPKGQGMTSMWAMLPTEDAAALEVRLRTAADADTDPTDPRTAAQRQADALARLGEDGPADEAPGTTGGTAGTTAARRPRVEITVIAAAAEGMPERVEFVRGAYSSFDWLCGQVLAEENGGARFRLVDPLPGAEDEDQDPMKYFLSEALKRRIRLRDGTCRHPGCKVKAEDCEIDHVLAFDKADPARGGPTAEWNLVCLCKNHHLEKTFGPWTYLPGPRGDGELIILTETGHEYRTYPDGMLARARDQLLGVAAVRWFDRVQRAGDQPDDP
ncbi:DUF222 domain-containing protein [Dietzia sp. 179-F 9C3 NHS]|uniref:HNH endonuclease signature motif containing protein n=1 Tax=Dietzia sp. 179-F 9C3 NHS TaxID=3374295 RepID=UPI003879A2DD